ncbi:MAG: TIGR00282 family metallophosphoesterase [Nitrospirae bacterium]|nr:TIGR00282 family metallophosphoesterase [Nitrospirota bacterium]
MRIMFIGDVFGRPGRLALSHYVPILVNKENVDFVIANGENAAGGFGITEKTAKEIFASGVQVITTGNHIWDKKEAVELLTRNDRLLRPINYPPSVPGFGSGVYGFGNGGKIGVINLSGRVFMGYVDCPFRAISPVVEEIKKQTNLILVDVHAEATSEKLGLGHYLDGRVSAVLGTHTHVQTADERVLPKSTAYITDVGMTGPEDSIIGVKKEQIIEKFFNQIPVRYEVARGPGQFSAVIVDVDGVSGLALSIRRLALRYPE